MTLSLAALIAAGVDPNAADTRPVIGHGVTPLHFAANADDLELIQALVAAGADVNARSRAGHTPLWWPCNGGRLAAARECAGVGRADALTRRGDLTPDQPVPRKQGRGAGPNLVGAGNLRPGTSF
jgi:hypothetical protein